MIDNVLTFIRNNPIPALLIGIAVLLLIALLVLLTVWLSRRNRQNETTINSPYGSSAAESPPFSQGTPFSNSGGYGSNPSTGGVGYANSTSPTVGMPGTPIASATSAPTAFPAATPNYPASPPFASPAFGSMPQPPAAGGQAPVGGTIVLDRASRPKHAALLIDRRDVSKRHDLRAETDIGRSGSSANAIAVADITVSRQHARIRLQGEKFVLFDLASANGTFVNGQRVEQPHTLNDGDIVRFGDVEFMFKQLT